MKNLLKFFLFVAVISLLIAWLYDVQVRRGTLGGLTDRRTPEKYTLPTESSINPKQVASLDALNRERRELVNSVVPSVVSIKTSKKISVRRQMQLDPFEFFSPIRGAAAAPREMKRWCRTHSDPA